MGLIKLAIVGGAAYYAVKGIKSERENRQIHANNGGDGNGPTNERGWCTRSRNSQREMPATPATGVYEERQIEYYQGQPPTYPLDQSQLQSTQNVNEKTSYSQSQIQRQIQQQEQPPQYPASNTAQLNFVEPRHHRNISDLMWSRDRNSVDNSNTNGNIADAQVSPQQTGTLNRSTPLLIDHGHEDAVEQAMRHLQSGNQDRAREILASAVSRRA